MAGFIIPWLVGDHHAGCEKDAIFVSIGVMRILVHRPTERNAVTYSMTVITADSPKMSP